MILRILVLLTLLSLAALGLSACGASQRETTLHGSFVGVSAAAEGFVTWDHDHQNQIVTDAVSLADGQAKLAAYRAQREKISTAFEVAYRAIALAATNEHAALSDAVDAVKALYEAIASLQAPLAASPDAPVPTTTPGAAPSPPSPAPVPASAPSH